MSIEANTGSSKSWSANKGLRTQELLGRVADRDLEALEGLYDQFAPRLMGLLLRILRARAEAESVLQEVFLRLWKEALGIAQTKGSLAAWLVLSSRQIALKRLRAQRAVGARPTRSPRGQGRTKEGKAAGKSAVSGRKEDKARERRSTKSHSETSLFLAASPQVWMPRAQDIALVDVRMGLLQRAFNQMPKPQRHALELAVFGGYTESEIAEQLGEPLGKVNAGLRAAFTFLRHRQHAVLGTWTADI
jgi:RNA polymerase sigma-70 factor (ECF subfamily)